MVRGDAEPRGQAWGPGAVPGAGAPAAEVAPSRGPVLELGILGTPAPPGHCLSMAQGGLGAPDSPRWVRLCSASWNSPIAFLGIASLLGFRGLLNASLDGSTRCLPATARAYGALI